MKYWLGLFVVLAIISPLVFFWMVFDSVKGLNADDMPREAIEGKQVWQRGGCVECHSIFGNGGYQAPDLTHELSQRGEDWLREFFLHPRPMRPHQGRKHLELNWDEAEAIIEFLRYIDGISVLGWPPTPHLNPGPLNRDRGGE